jgi:hypothetical protein
MNLIRELVTIAPDCECIKVTYTLVGEEPVTVEVDKRNIINGKNAYRFIDGVNTININWSDDETYWQIQTEGGLQATLSEDTPCPFGVYTIEEDSIFSAFIVEPCY